MKNDINSSTLNIVSKMKYALIRDTVIALILGTVLFLIADRVNVVNYLHKLGYRHQFYDMDMVINFLLASFLIYSVFSLLRFIEMIKFFRVMLKISRYDYLTKVYNRRSLIELLEMEFERNNRSVEGRFSFILFDIDDFKSINDNFGHSVGDQVLKKIGDTLLATVRKTDICGRFGGDEFAVILPYTHLENAVNVAEKIKSAISETSFRTNKTTIKITLSIGVIEIQHGSSIDNFEKLISEADKYLYRAKKMGKNTVCSDMCKKSD